MRDIARLDDYRPETDTRDSGTGHLDMRSPRESEENPTTPVTPERTPRPSEREPLWREALGERLRAHRTHRGETLTQTADRAGVSPQYLSEMERGLKEPSSEMIAAVAGALGLSLTDLVGDVARHLVPRSHRSSSSAPQLLATAA